MPSSVQPPTSIDRTGTSQAGAALTAWTSTLPPGSIVDLGEGASYLCDKGWQIIERTGLVVRGTSAQLVQTPGTTATAAATLSVIGGRDLDVEIAAIGGANTAWQPSAHTNRESHHCLYLSGVVDSCFYRSELHHPWGDFVYYGRKKIGPSGSDSSYVPCVNVWVTGMYGHHAGRQWVTGQGVRDCVTADNEWDKGLRSGFEMEGLRNAGNGVDGWLIQGNVCGEKRLNLIANGGSQRADNVTFRDNRLAGSLTLYGRHADGHRRTGWEITGNRLLLPGEARHVVGPDPARPPHHGTPAGAALVFYTPYDDLTITGNGPFYLDDKRTPPMVWALLTDPRNPIITGNDIRLVQGGDRVPDQWNPRGPGVEYRIVP